MLTLAICEKCKPLPEDPAIPAVEPTRRDTPLENNRHASLERDGQEIAVLRASEPDLSIAAKDVVPQQADDLVAH